MEAQCRSWKRWWRWRRPAAFLLFVELKCDASEDSADPVVLADAAYDVIGQDFWTNDLCRL